MGEKKKKKKVSENSGPKKCKPKLLVSHVINDLSLQNIEIAYRDFSLNVKNFWVYI